MLKFIEKLITNNNGISSKSFGLVLITFMSVLLLSLVVIILIIDLFTDLKIETDLYGITTLIISISTLFLSAVYGKVKGDSYEQYNLKNKKHDTSRRIYKKHN